jgi:hypothetical protein
MPPEVLDTLLKRLLGAAQPRPDLITPGSTGRLENARPATFLGRVVTEDEPLESILGRFPMGEAETGGLAMQAPEFMKAAIPLGLWKAMTPEAKAIVTNYANKYPLKFERALSEPQDLFAIAQNSGPGNHGFYNNYGKQGSTISVGEASVKRGTTAHEMQHYLDRNRIRETKPTDAATIGYLLEEQLLRNMPEGREPEKYIGSLLNVTDQLQVRDPILGVAGKPSDLLNWMLSKEPKKRPRNARPGFKQPDLAYMSDTATSAPISGANDILRRMMMDEGLAYLAQHSADKDAPSMLKLLAARLGVLPE